MSNQVTKTQKGRVVSAKMDKTVVVRVDRYARHPKYLKRYLISKKYFAHNHNNKAKLGDTVIIKESRPLSRLKRWTVQEIVASASIVDSTATKE
ncbi:MAG: 30S ribosomal protein S17 [Patescibacteria group bacterium]